MHLIRIKKCHQPYRFSSFYIRCATKQYKYLKPIYHMSNKKAMRQIDKLERIRERQTQEII